MTLRLALCFVLWVASVSSAEAETPVPVPENWKRIEIGPVSFFVPSDVRPVDAPKDDPAATAVTPTQGSFLRALNGPSLFFSVSYGPASVDSLDSLGVGGALPVSTHYESIGGKRAKMQSFTSARPSGTNAFRWTNCRAVFFIADTGKAKMRLEMVASCKDVTSCREVEDIFRTVRFKPDGT